MAQAKKNIPVIPAAGTYDRHIRPQMKALRVAAYCRVSTLQEQQESSYEAQVSYYTEKIRGNPNWKLAGIYADDGKSATSTKKRSDFQAMIDDCMAGKIDMVLTKSISRFARNTVDALINIRKLKEKNIAVFFEKESINTLEGSGELLLTILSSQAQEESRNVSENCHWGIVRKFEDGKGIVNHSKFMGYQRRGWKPCNRAGRSGSGAQNLPTVSGGQQQLPDQKDSGSRWRQNRNWADNMVCNHHRQDAFK